MDRIKNWYNVDRKFSTSGRTALIWAAGGGHEAVVWLVIERGANVNVKIQWGFTALSWAAIQGHQTVVWLLVERGPEIDVKTAPPLQLEAAIPLIQVAKMGQDDMVNLLLELGANIEAKDHTNNTALIHAAEGDRNSESVVRLLLEKGADVEAKNAKNRTALIVAAEKGHSAVVQLLLERGANIEARGVLGRTALVEARIGLMHEERLSLKDDRPHE